ncbi:hypothetical protein C5S31_02295 [ANME-1 cluster archaeon GoMg2]|nr:hypothetical protein [ANME-1 cluster archaeon GoMg2]
MNVKSVVVSVGLILRILAAIIAIANFYADIKTKDQLVTIPPEPTPTITLTPTPISSPTPISTHSVTVKITEPKDGSDFPLLDTSKLVGIISYVPDDQHLWIVMLQPPNPIYYPFPDEPVIYGDTWETISYGVGEDNEEQDGDTFIIGAYLLDEKAYEEIKEYVKKSVATDTWDGMYPLPEGATEYDNVRVIGRL